MGPVTREIRAEIRRLPLTLGKLLGGLAAVIGFAAAAGLATRRPGLTPENFLPPLLLGAAGIAVFLLSGRMLSRRSSLPGENSPPAAGRAGANLLPWALLLAFGGLFLACAYLLTLFY